MVRSVSLVTVMSVFTALASGVSQSSTPPLDVMPGLVKALAARDIEAVVAFYADDALLFPAHEPAVRGKDNIRRWYQKFLADGYAAVRMESNSGMHQGSVGYVTSSYVIGIPAAPVGGPRQELFRSVLGLRHDQSKWLIQSHAFNSEGPPRCK